MHQMNMSQHLETIGGWTDTHGVSRDAYASGTATPSLALFIPGHCCFRSTAISRSCPGHGRSRPTAMCLTSTMHIASLHPVARLLVRQLVVPCLSGNMSCGRHGTNPLASVGAFGRQCVDCCFGQLFSADTVPQKTCHFLTSKLGVKK